MKNIQGVRLRRTRGLRPRVSRNARALTVAAGAFILINRHSDDGGAYYSGPKAPRAAQPHTLYVFH